MENIKQLKITPPKGYEIDKSKSTFETIVFKLIENKYPKTVGELNIIKGYFITASSSIRQAEGEHNFNHYIKNTFPTKEIAEANLALTQLLQLRNRYWKIDDNYKPDWKNQYVAKYCITINKYKITTECSYTIHQIFSFKTQQTRNLFYDNFKKLLEQTIPLYN